MSRKHQIKVSRSKWKRQTKAILKDASIPEVHVPNPKRHLIKYETSKLSPPLSVSLGDLLP